MVSRRVGDPGLPTAPNVRHASWVAVGNGGCSRSLYMLGISGEEPSALVAGEFFSPNVRHCRLVCGLTVGGTSAYTGSMSTVDDQRERLEFLQGTLEVLILQSLQVARNHAYGISQFLEQQSGHEFLVDNGSLYPALQRLLQRKWIAAEWKTSPNGRRARYYSLTALGRKQLIAATSKWMRFVEAMGRILAPEG
jgi:PadR family transcriptional regulator PadR